MRGNKIASLGTCAKGVQFYFPSHTYAAIPYCTNFFCPKRFFSFEVMLHQSVLMDFSLGQQLKRLSALIMAHIEISSCRSRIDLKFMWFWYFSIRCTIQKRMAEKGRRLIRQLPRGSTCNKRQNFVQLWYNLFYNFPTTSIVLVKRIVLHKT